MKKSHRNKKNLNIKINLTIHVHKQLPKESPYMNRNKTAFSLFYKSMRLSTTKFIKYSCSFFDIVYVHAAKLPASCLLYGPVDFHLQLTVCVIFLMRTLLYIRLDVSVSGNGTFISTTFFSLVLLKQSTINCFSME